MRGGRSLSQETRPDVMSGRVSPVRGEGALDKKISLCYNAPIHFLLILLADMLASDKKQRIIKKFQTHEGDTGSSDVQIAILSSEIDELAAHLKQHHKDHSSRRGLLRKVGERRRLLRYLKKENLKAYEDLVKKLKLKIAKGLEKPVVQATLPAMSASDDNVVRDDQEQD